MLNVKFSNSSKKFLKKCDDLLYRRFIAKIKELQRNSFPKDAKRIVNRKEKVFRVRVGDYRILYSVFSDFIFISEIDKRERVYG